MIGHYTEFHGKWDTDSMVNNTLNSSIINSTFTIPNTHQLLSTLITTHPWVKNRGFYTLYLLFTFFLWDINMRSFNRNRNQENAIASLIQYFIQMTISMTEWMLFQQKIFVKEDDWKINCLWWWKRGNLNSTCNQIREELSGDEFFDEGLIMLGEGCDKTITIKELLKRQTNIIRTISIDNHSIISFNQTTVHIKNPREQLKTIFTT